MYKRDPILKGWDLEIDKDSKNYIEMKAMLMEFKREYQLQQKRSSRFYSGIYLIKFSISHIHYKFNPEPSCSLE